MPILLFFLFCLFKYGENDTQRVKRKGQPQDSKKAFLNLRNLDLNLKNTSLNKKKIKKGEKFKTIHPQNLLSMEVG